MDILGAVGSLMVDPTGTLYATEKATETAAGIIETGVDVLTGGLAGAAGKTTPVLGAKENKTVINFPTFQIQNDFLLNTKTGAVWKYDSTKNSFNMVTVEKTKLQLSIQDLFFNHLSSSLEDSRLAETAKINPLLRKQFETKFDTVIKTLSIKQ
jgi:hypothetical protein